MLEAQGLTKRYSRHAVVDGVDFRLAPGECLGIVGHNGSGKSTLLSLVAQAVPPSAGRLLYEGRPVLGDKRFMQHMVGYVPQQDALLPDLRVGETVRYWRALLQLPKTDGDSPVSLMGLAEIWDKRVDRLSGGMKKRLSIALALLPLPPLLLLDEALAALDHDYRRRLEAYIATHKAGGGALLYCSHEPAEIRRLCNRVLVLQGGRRVFYGDIEAFPAEGPELDRWMEPA